MPTIDDLLKKLPAETRDTVRFVWESLPPSERAALQNLLTAFPSEANLIRLLLSLSTTQLRMAFGQKRAVVIVGPANVGKSTLYNQLAQRKEDRAVVSPIPGTTRVNQAADAGLFLIVDTPGADVVGPVGERERQQALNAAQAADLLVIVFDAIQGIKQTELDMFTLLQGLDKPFVVALNKMDLVRRDLDSVVQASAQALQIPVEQVIPISARDGKNLDALLMAIAAVEPELVAALGRSLPQYRWQLAWRSIASSASVSAVIALTPLPFLDFAPLLINQSMMVLGIARVYNYQITIERARELVVTFGLGFLGRTLFHELSKFAGVPGWLLSAAIAASTTVVMGYAAVQWFETGTRVSQETLNSMSRRLTGDLLNTLKHLGKRKPGKKALQETIAQSLEQTGLGQVPPGPEISEEKQR